MSETREFRRIPKEVKVDVIKLEYPMVARDGTSVMSVNIAQNGICFLSEKEYVQGDILNLKISLNGLRRYIKSIHALMDESHSKAPLSVVAKVVWIKPAMETEMYEVGASFENVDTDEYKALDKYLSCIID